MVQKQLTKAYNKLGIQANNTLKIENKQTIKKPSLQTHDGKSKRAHLKVIKMKKSQSIKKSNVEGGLQSSSKTYDVPHQPEKPSLLVTPTKTPSPKKPSPFKSSDTSPNYMKSTSSSEAKKENTTKVSNVKSTTTKLHKVAKTFIKSSSLKKVRTLTKAPSFKHTRSTACKKVVLCQSSNLDVQRVTCSSTLKDSKFPNYLKLKPGATEAEGNSAFKVCPYTYCSLNGHHHINAPPLKRFLSSRRRITKTLKLGPEILSSRKAKPSKYFKTEGKEDQNEEFFVEVFVSGREVIETQVSQSLSDGPFSEIDFEDILDQNETNLSGMILGSDGEGYTTLVQKQLSFENNEEINSTSSVSLDEFYGENSDMEWEEGHSPDVHDVCVIYVQTDYSKDNQDSLGYEFNKNASGNLGFLADEYPQQFHGEIVECLHYSDTDSSSDSESTKIGQKLIEQIVVVTDGILSEPNERTEHTYLANEATECGASLEDKSTDEQCTTIYNPLEGFLEVQDEEFDTYEALVATIGEDSDKENYTVVEFNEDNSAAFDMEQTKPSISILTSSGSGHENTCHSITNSEEDDSGKPELYSDNNYALEIKASEMQALQKTEEADISPIRENKMQICSNGISNNGEPDSNMKPLEMCNKLKRSMRRKKAHEGIEEEREFNPRGPNFLPIELEPEAEKVDLRHQKMDKRRNADEWMLDYALQKTVNQLVPAQKRVALLIEAFESVLPIPKRENRMRRNSSALHARPIQACS